MSIVICDECLHMVFENKICRCTEGKVIGCMYIGLVEGCTYYDISTNKRCKKRVIETENGKLFMCIEHGSKKKVHIKTTESKKTTSKKTSDESKKSETEIKKKEKSETQTEKKRTTKKKVEKKEVEKKEVEPKKKPVKRKIIKKIKEDE